MSQITPQDFPEIRWKGHWVWVPEEAIQPGGFFPGADDFGPKPESHGLFRKTFTLANVPARAPARITADSRYVMFVNGQEVFRGPIRSQPRRMHYDLFDIAPYLKPGENTIAVYVKYYGSTKSYWMPASPNVILGKSGVLVFETNLGDAGWLVSDESWKAKKSDAWLPPPAHEGPGVVAGVANESVDARQLPFAWEQPSFDDAAWGNAQVLRAMHIGGFAHSQPPTDPYGPLYPRPIGKLGGETYAPLSVKVETLPEPGDVTADNPAKVVVATLAAPVSQTATTATFPVRFDVPAGGAVRLLMDMGRIVSGLPQFELEAPAGTVFDFFYAEDPLKPGVPMGFGAPHGGTRYIARGSDDRFQVFDSNGLRYIYAVVHGASGPVTLKHYAIWEDVYPWTPGASFECSDEDMNRLYRAGIRTVQLNSRDAFMDCPTREQRAWVGDSVVHQMVHLTTNLDWRLAWQYLNLGNSPRSDGILPMSVAGDIEYGNALTIPDWSLHWVHGVYNLYRFLGDKDAVKSYMPTIERILRWYTPFQTSAGVLKDVTEWNLVDWAALLVEDCSSLLTALWGRGLSEFAEMAAWLEEKASQRWAEGLHAKAKTGFEMFWDEARGSYVDHVKDGAQQKEMSQLGGAFAILSELAPKERWARIIETITDATKLVVRSWTGAETGEYSPEKMMKQFQGIYEPDWDVDKQIVIGQPFISYTVHDAVAKAGLADKLPELCKRWLQFLVNGYDTIGECWGWGTHVHGWSSTPTKDLVFYTLGVTPAEPGYAKARIAPRLGGLQWAKGVVPTPHGLIKVEATQVSVTVESPVPVVVELPGRAPQTLPAGKHEVK